MAKTIAASTAASETKMAGRSRTAAGRRSTAVMTAPRPMSTSADPPGGCGPAWERPGARPANGLTQGVSCGLPRHHRADALARRRMRRAVAHHAAAVEHDDAMRDAEQF